MFPFFVLFGAISDGGRGGTKGTSKTFGKVFAKRLLKDGVEYCAQRYGPVAAIRALGASGWWLASHELYAKERGRVMDGRLHEYALCNPTLSAAQIAEGMAFARRAGAWTAPGHAFQVAAFLKAEKRVHDALEVLAWCREQWPQEARAWALTLEYLTEAGLFEEALQVLRQCPRDIWPDETLLGRLIRDGLAQRPRGEADALFRAVMTLVPYSVRTPHMLACQVAGRGFHDAAAGVELLREAAAQGSGWSAQELIAAGVLAINQCVQVKAIECGMEVFRWAFQNGLAKGTNSFALIVGQLSLALARKTGSVDLVEECLKMLMDCGGRLDASSYGALITVNAKQRRWDVAARVLDEMESAGVRVTKSAVGDLLDALHEARDWALERDTWVRCMERGGMAMDWQAYAKYLRCLFKLGWEDAWKLYKSNVLPPNVVVYSTMINGMQRWGKVREAMEVVEDMMKMSSNARYNVVPNEVVYTTLRSMCRTYGLERHWPRYRDWCVKHGVKGGESVRAWRTPDMDPVSSDTSRLLFPQ